jgi:acyl carrier protein
LPRTEGTGKLKRAAIREWVRTGAAPAAARPAADTLAALVSKYAGRGDLSPTTTMDELGLSSLEQVELMVALEDAFQARLDEKAFSGARDVGQLRAVVEEASKGEVEPLQPLQFPAWNRSRPARFVRRPVAAGAVRSPYARPRIHPPARSRLCVGARGRPSAS